MNVSVKRKLQFGCRGYSLLELLVTLALVAIFLVFAVPGYHSVGTQDRMAAEINDLRGGLELARSSAVKQGVDVTVCASSNPTASKPQCSGKSNWQTGWIVFTDPNDSAQYTPSSGQTLLHSHAALAAGDVLTGNTGSPGALSGPLPAVTFNRLGGTGNVGVLSLHDAANTLRWRRCLVLAVSGHMALDTEAQQPGVCP